MEDESVTETTAAKLKLRLPEGLTPRDGHRLLLNMLTLAAVCGADIDQHDLKQTKALLFENYEGFERGLAMLGAEHALGRWKDDPRDEPAGPR
jgi:hypothetical protein